MMSSTVKKIFLFIIVLLITDSIYAYSFDTLKYKIYVDSVSKIYYNSPELAIKLGKELYEYTNRIGDNESNESILNSLSLAYFYTGDRKESLLYLNILRNIYTKKHDDDKLSLVLNRIGALYQDWSLQSEALNYFNLAYKHAIKSKNQARIGQCYNNLGLINKDQENYDKAFDYFTKAKEIYSQLNDKKNLAFTLNNIGIVYKRVKSYEKSLNYFKQAAEIKKELGDNRTLANSYGNMAEVYMELNDYANAEKYYQESIILRTQNNDQENLIKDLLALSKLNALSNNIAKAKNYLSEAERKITVNSLPDNKRYFYEVSSLIFEKTNDVKNAFLYYKKAKEIEDSTFNEESRQKAMEIEYLVNSEQKEQEINNLRLENQIAVEKIRKELSTRYILLISLVLIFAVLLVIFIRLKTGQKARLAIEEKNIHIEKINEELVSVNDELEQRVRERTELLEKEMKIKEETLVKLEMALKKAEESNYLKDAFLANINHEIRTPLSAIVGLTEVLKNRLSKVEIPDVDKYVDGISQSCNRLLNLLNNIIDLSRVQANDIKPHIESCNPNNLIRKVGDLFVFRINEKKLELTYALGDIKPIACDKDMMFKVLVDILDNAVKYTNKGKIEISSSLISNGKEVAISIADTGIGIDEAFLPHVFDTFRQESTGYDRLYQGAGLGLPLSQRMVKLMGGRIEISSKKNFGTNVSIILPVAEVIEEPIFKSALREKVTLKPTLSDILLVEDDEFNALYIKTILEQIANVDWVKDGNEAINIISNRQKTYDVLILDINLPNEWEGVSLQKAIRERFQEYNNVPFIAQTAYSMTADKERILNNGFVEYFSKPINSEHFLNTVQFLLVNKNKS